MPDSSLSFVSWCKEVARIQFTPFQESIAHVIGGGDPTSDVDKAVWGFTGPVDENHRAIISLRCGRRSGKTMISALYALWRAMTADLSAAGPGDIPTVAIVAPLEPLAKIALRVVVDVASSFMPDNINTKTREEGRKSPAITSDTLKLLREDGREVHIRSVPKSANGRSIRGYTLIAVILDEAEQFDIGGDKEASDVVHVHAATPAILMGGSIIMISTPYKPDSYMSQHVERNFGHPVDGLAAVATTRNMRTDSQHIQKMVAREIATRDDNALREYECVMTQIPGAFFDTPSIAACTTESPAITHCYATAAIDAAFLHDSFGLVAIERQGDKIVQTLEFERRPEPDKPLDPFATRAEAIELCKAYSALVVGADVHEWASTAVQLTQAGIQVTKAPTANAFATAAYQLRALLRAGKITVLPETAKQLKAITQTNAGLPELPRSAHGHCDLVAALITSIHLDQRHGPVGASIGMAFPAPIRQS